MTKLSTDSPQWAMVDEGWGRKAVDFATLSEPGNCREYVAVHHRLGVDAGDRLLDVACGSGLAIELARLRGATCTSYRLPARHAIDDNTMTSGGAFRGQPARASRTAPYRATKLRKITGGQVTWLRMACALISSACSGSK